MPHKLPITTFLRPMRIYNRAQAQCPHQQQLHHAFRQSIRHLSQQRLNYQPASKPGIIRSSWSDLKRVWRGSPLMVSLALFSMACGAAGIIYANYRYQTYVINAFHKYPEEVAKPLRRALFYTNIEPDYPKALQYYVQAIDQLKELKMFPFSEEVLGVYLQLAAMFEKSGNYDRAIEVLEQTRNEEFKWLHRWDEVGGKGGFWSDRTRILKQTVAISVKLAELYSCDYVRDHDNAQAHLTYAVETTMKEHLRRQREGTKEDEGEWMSAEEMGAQFEQLGHVYEGKEQYELAGPLFFQALQHAPPNSCHRAVIMNNLSAAISQQPPPDPKDMKMGKQQLVKLAQQWATKAIELTAKIAPPDRTEECDVACATATHNLGRFAEMNGDMKGARRRYDEALVLSKAIGFTEGVSEASGALARLG